jgi:hypothetical protein
VALVAAALVLAAASGWGKAPPKAGPSPKAAPAVAKATPATPRASPPSKATPPKPASETPAPVATGRGEAKSIALPIVESDAGVKVVEKGDGGAKQFRFTETEVEGRLKAPQLVYFLRRVRAEFAAGDLGHRSFMRELSETQRDDSF